MLPLFYMAPEDWAVTVGQELLRQGLHYGQHRFTAKSECAQCQECPSLVCGNITCPDASSSIFEQGLAKVDLLLTIFSAVLVATLGVGFCLGCLCGKLNGGFGEPRRRRGGGFVESPSAR